MMTATMAPDMRKGARMIGGTDAGQVAVERPQAGGLEWMVVRTNVKCEQRARAALMARGFEVYLPILARWKIRARRKHLASDPLFARYLFVMVDRSSQSVYPILSTDGVESLLCVNDRPAVVPRKIIEELRGFETLGLFDRTVKRSPINVKPGQDVRIIGGPFDSFTAKVLAAPEGQRVALLMSIFGRKGVMRIDAGAIEVI